VYDRNPRGYFHSDNVVEHKTNSAGFRGPEIPVAKPINSSRILFLGDSSTFGEGVYFEDTYPEKFKTFIEKNVEAINLGVGGYETSQEYTVLKYANLDGLAPDAVIVGYNLNDAEGPLIKFNDDGSVVRNINSLESSLSAVRKFPLYAKMSRTLRIIYGWIEGRKLSQETVQYYHDLYNDNNQNWENTKKAIQDFGNYQKTSGIQVTFVLFPVLFDLKHYPFAAETQKVKDELDNNGIKYIDLLPGLNSYNGPELWVHPTDQHPNEIVHRIAAEALVKHFQDEKK